MKCDPVDGLNSMHITTIRKRMTPSFMGPHFISFNHGHSLFLVRYHEAATGSSLPVVIAVVASSQDVSV